MSDTIERMTHAIRALDPVSACGRISDVSGDLITAQGLGARIALSDRVEIGTRESPLFGEVIRIDHDAVHILPESPTEGLCVGGWVRRVARPRLSPDASWLGRVIDPDGAPLDGRPLLPGMQQQPMQAKPPEPGQRRALGARVSTGFAVLDTLLPLARGQRLGLFAGSGVGKSTLLGHLTKGVDADVIVIGLVGERGRELREFIEKVLGAEGLARSVVVAATSDRAPQIRRRCAWASMAVAEYFRDQGKHVLLLMDSVTRFAEAHRELAVTAGEGANLRGFPASTASAIASLCERAGPGCGDSGDITAIFSVLVAGSDMEEPVADMLRGVLDGHIVLDRSIAERGRFPAIDLVRSVSRSLPDVATDAENALIGQARRLLGTYDRSEMMIKAGLYVSGSDPELDQAVAVHPALDRFIALEEPRGVEASFAALRAVLP